MDINPRNRTKKRDCGSESVSIIWGEPQTVLLCHPEEPQATKDPRWTLERQHQILHCVQDDKITTPDSSLTLRMTVLLCHPEEPQATKDPGWTLENQSSRRGRLAPVLSHHRTYRSVYGGSRRLTEVLPGRPGSFRQGRSPVRAAGRLGTAGGCGLATSLRRSSPLEIFCCLCLPCELTGCSPFFMFGPSLRVLSLGYYGLC